MIPPAGSGAVKRTLGAMGSQLGTSLTYVAQAKPRRLAQAYILAERVPRWPPASA